MKEFTERGQTVFVCELKTFDDNSEESVSSCERETNITMEEITY
jgi:hypothetical protein